MKLNKSQWLFFLPFVIIALYCLRIPCSYLLGYFLTRIALPSIVLALIVRGALPSRIGRSVSLVLIPIAIMFTVASSGSEQGEIRWEEAITIIGVALNIALFAPIWIACSLCLDPKVFLVNREETELSSGVDLSTRADAGLEPPHMKRYANIVLVGFMGTGKTSVGKALAERLRMAFVDMDEVIEQREGMTVSRIFEEKGEPRFRALERQLVLELSTKSGLVVGAGGGIVLNWDNISDFSRNGLVVCLSARPETILARLSADSSRPLLAEGDKKSQIMTLLDSRKKLYDAVQRQIDTTDLTVGEIADRIVALFHAGYETSEMDEKK